MANTPSPKISTSRRKPSGGWFFANTVGEGVFFCLLHESVNSCPVFSLRVKGVDFVTNKQKQCLLMYLGYYSGAIDGIWGKQSRTAAGNFQREYGLEADPEFGESSECKILEAICLGEGESWWEDIAYFERSEFACKCGRYCDGYPAEMDKALIRTADRLRKHFGVPVLVSSGLRCQTHNANVGGVANSRHVSGKAMDFCVTGKTAAAVLEFVQQQPEIRYAYAIDGQYVHMDVN